MPNIRKLLDLSTAHLPEHLFNSEVEGEGANVDSYHWGTVVYPLEHGALLWVPDDPKESAEAGTDGETTQADVLKIQLYARGLGCDYVLFDADASEDPNLPTWDWGQPEEEEEEKIETEAKPEPDRCECGAPRRPDGSFACARR